MALILVSSDEKVGFSPKYVANPFSGKARMSAVLSETQANYSPSEGDASSDSSSELSVGRFKHYHQPTVLDSPGLVDAARRFLDCRDVGAIAALSRRRGLPPHLRREAWPLLLQSHPYVVHSNMKAPEGAQPPSEKRLRGELRRLKQKIQRVAPQELEENNPDDLFSAIWQFAERWQWFEPMLVWVAYFLSRVFGTSQLDPTDFERLMLFIGHDDGHIPLFVSALRTLVPDISQHFDREDVMSAMGGDEWLSGWIQWYAVRQWDWHDVARLFDCYLSWREGEGIEPSLHHVFCALAAMRSHGVKLLELDQSEIRQLLSHLPQSKDIERLMSTADSLCEEWQAVERQATPCVTPQGSRSPTSSIFSAAAA